MSLAGAGMGIQVLAQCGEVKCRDDADSISMGEMRVCILG